MVVDLSSAGCQKQRRVCAADCTATLSSTHRNTDNYKKITQTTHQLRQATHKTQANPRSDHTHTHPDHLDQEQRRRARVEAAALEGVRQVDLCQIGADEGGPRVLCCYVRGGVVLCCWVVVWCCSYVMSSVCCSAGGVGVAFVLPRRQALPPLPQRACCSSPSAGPGPTCLPPRHPTPTSSAGNSFSTKARFFALACGRSTSKNLTPARPRPRRYARVSKPAATMTTWVKRGERGRRCRRLGGWARVDWCLSVWRLRRVRGGVV